LRVLRNLGLLSRVARHYGVPPIQIGRRALYLYRHHNFGFQDAMRCGLLDPNLPDAAAFGCIRRADITPIQNRHNRVEWKCLTEDKAVFYSFCGHAGIPAPEMLAVVGYFANDLPAEFVVKPTLGAHGKGFRLYCRDAADFSAPCSTTISPNLLSGITSSSSAAYAVTQTSYN
jgi:hypothetical protein